tara:strand:+ start:355 stop:696 length:342 start_codon:yes stop_codon:yes gene_type:complete
MKKKNGRPDDKLSYINSFMSLVKHSDGSDQDLKKALNKLNAKEIVILNCYLSKMSNRPIDKILGSLPLDTPAQMGRTKIAIEYYNKLELIDESVKRKSYSEENREEAVRPEYI